MTTGAQEKFPGKFFDFGGAVFNVQHLDFGAVGDGAVGGTGTDDTTAIQDTFDAAGSGKVVVPPGAYRLTSTITIGDVGAQLLGVGSTAGSVRFIIDHNNGPGFLVTKGSVVLQDFEVLASTARKAGAAGSNYGIQLEGPDAASASLTRQRWSGISSRDHPNHGIVLAGTIHHSIFEQLDTRDNGGHGIVVDDGGITSRTNVQQSGLCSLIHCTSSGNGGHGLTIGTPTQAFATSAIRVRVYGYDGGPNATDAAIRFTTDDVWVFGENIDVVMSAFSGAGFGILMQGRNVRLLNSRIVGALTRGVTVGVHANADTRGAVIENLRIITDTSLDPVIVINSGPIKTKIRVPVLFNVTRLVDDSGTASDISAASGVITPTALAAGDTNDYDPESGGESLETVKTLRLSADSSGSTLTGMFVAASTWEGKRIRIINVSSNLLTLGHQNTGSISVYRFISPTATDVLLGQDGAADLEYDNTTNRWHITNVVNTPVVQTLANDATPTVKGGSFFKTGGTTTITDLDDGVVGQTINILSEHAITITDGTNILLNGSANFVMAAGDVLVLSMYNDQVWVEDSRQVN